MFLLADSKEHEKMQQLKEQGNTFLKENKLDLALEMDTEALTEALKMYTEALKMYTEALKVVLGDDNLRKQMQITLREVWVFAVCNDFAL